MMCMAWFYWDPNPQIFTLPWIEWPILWYGFFFTLGFALGFWIFVQLLTRFFQSLQDEKEMARRKAVQIADRLTLYLVIATVLGARLGHFLFYENPSDYLKNPLDFFRVWEGGLASHGAVVAILFAVFLFSRRIRADYPVLNAWHLLDLLAPPAALASAFIRVGNFFNQEVLGTPTDLPWAVIFGHPMDHSFPVPRHPVQLYEAFFYFLSFLLLWRLSWIPRFLQGQGRLLGILLVSIFGFRFLVEFLKEEQSHLLGDAFLTMGQLLSLPLVCLGIYLLARKINR